MGHLDVHIRHGSGGGGEGLAALVLGAAVVMALIHMAWGAISAALHVILTALEVIAWTVAGAAVTTVVTGGVVAGLRIRTAVHVAHARRAAVARPVVTITPDGYVRPVPAEADRPAIEPPRRSAPWPLPGWWEEIRPQIGGDSDEHRPR